MSAHRNPVGSRRWIARDTLSFRGVKLARGVEVTVMGHVPDIDGECTVSVKLADGLGRLVRPYDLTDVDPAARCCEHDDDAHDGSGCLDCDCNKAPFSPGFNPTPAFTSVPDVEVWRDWHENGDPAKDEHLPRHYTEFGAICGCQEIVSESVRDADAEWTYNRWSAEAYADGDAPPWSELDDESRHDFIRFAEDARRYFTGDVTERTP